MAKPSGWALTTCRSRSLVHRETRHATMRNHTATHLLHAALRERLGTHVRQAGSAVRPDKLRFDFTHGQSLSPAELRDVEDRVNEWIKASAPVRWLEMERAEAESLGAMALFGEKYGEWVRVVEIEGVSRELCGGTHVANTAEIGIFKVSAEGSSAANVRRIEAITGPAAIDFFRDRDAALREAGELLGNPQDPVAGARRAAERLKEASAGAAEGPGSGARRGSEAARRSGGRDRRRPGAGRGDRARRPEIAARRRQPDPVLARRTRSPRCSAAVTARRSRWSRWRRRGRSRRAFRRRSWCAPRRASSAVAGAAATTWRRPAAAIRRSSTRRWPRRGL